MEELKERLPEFLSDRLYQIIISNPRSKGEQPGNEISKIKIRPVSKGGSLLSGDRDERNPGLS